LDDKELKGVHEIAEIEDRWYEPNAEYFRVRSSGGKRTSCVAIEKPSMDVAERLRWRGASGETWH
jgi:hypothetical protein